METWKQWYPKRHLLESRSIFRFHRSFHIRSDLLCRWSIPSTVKHGSSFANKPYRDPGSCWLTYGCFQKYGWAPNMETPICRGYVVISQSLSTWTKGCIFQGIFDWHPGMDIHPNLYVFQSYPTRSRHLKLPRSLKILRLWYSHLFTNFLDSKIPNISIREPPRQKTLIYLDSRRVFVWWFW